MAFLETAMLESGTENLDGHLQQRNLELFRDDILLGPTLKSKIADISDNHSRDKKAQSSKYFNVSSPGSPKLPFSFSESFGLKDKISSHQRYQRQNSKRTLESTVGDLSDSDSGMDSSSEFSVGHISSSEEELSPKMHLGRRIDKRTKEGKQIIKVNIHGKPPIFRVDTHLNNYDSGTSSKLEVTEKPAKNLTLHRHINDSICEAKSPIQDSINLIRLGGIKTWNKMDTKSKETGNDDLLQRDTTQKKTKTECNETFDESLVRLVVESPEDKPQSLISPKKLRRIPKTPHRPSTDAFWQQDTINQWNDEFSPIKELKKKGLKSRSIYRENQEPGKKNKNPSNAIPPKNSSSTIPNKATKEIKKLFHERKNAIAESFLCELDTQITKGEISRLAASTGGVMINWNKKLNSTAGRANWKRETIKHKNAASDNDSVAVTIKHYATIELAEKVIDDEYRLLNVIAHEFCHLANFMISNIKTNPHGKEFKSWAEKCSRCFSHRGIHVTTRHNYSIDYKYIWECENCGINVKRHSKSVDPLKHRCGNCKCKLVQVKPIPRIGNKTCQYQQFVRENLKKIREENPKSPQKEIMGLVGKRYQEQKALRLKLVESETDEIKESQLDADENINLLVQKLDIIDLTSP